MSSIDPSLYFLILYILGLIVALKRKTKWSTIGMYSLLFWYTAAVIILTLIPSIFDSSELELKNNFIPLKTILETASSKPWFVGARQLGGNVALFVPLGFFLNQMTRFTFTKQLVIALSLSFGIESLQYLGSFLLGYTYRITDVDDVVLNTAGFLVGLLCYMGLQDRSKKID